MQVVDLLAVVLVVAAGAAFMMGDVALAHTEDLHAVYWLGVGIAALRAAVHIARPEARA